MSDTDGVPGGVQHEAESGVAMRSIVAVELALADTWLVSSSESIGYTLIFVNGLIECVR
jgi:hypothetical protein